MDTRTVSVTSLSTPEALLTPPYRRRGRESLQVPHSWREVLLQLCHAYRELLRITKRSRTFRC